MGSMLTMRVANGSPLRCRKPGTRSTRGRSHTVMSPPNFAARACCAGLNCTSVQPVTIQ